MGKLDLVNNFIMELIERVLRSATNTMMIRQEPRS